MACPEISPSTGDGKFLLLKEGRKDVLLSEGGNDTVRSSMW